MKTALLKISLFSLALAACTSTRNSSQSTNDNLLVAATADEPQIAADQKPASLMDLPQTQDGGFILKPGFYEAEFKTYCLQPGTPDPHQGDAYLQGPISGHRKEIVETILLHSRDHQELDQRNIQLLLWGVVSETDFNNLSYEVQNTARTLLTPRQVFELQGGVMGVIKNVSATTGLLNANSDIRGLFQASVQSYEAYEKIAVLKEQSKIIKRAAKYDQWYRQKENYYVRYFPESYKRVRIQVYVPEGLLDSSNKRNDEYLVYDPTGQQAIPAFTNAQRLGIGAPMINILRQIIRINRPPAPPKKVSKKTDNSSI